MCRSIKTLREPYTTDVTHDEMHAAALQYVRKISGFRSPAPHNAEAFEAAVAAVTAATHDLLERLVVRSAPARVATD
jgi:hypothetical protein